MVAASTATGCNCLAIGCVSSIRVTLENVPIAAKLSIELTGAGRSLHAEVNADPNPPNGFCMVDDVNEGSCDLGDGTVELDLSLDGFDDDETTVTIKVLDDAGVTRLAASRTTTIGEISVGCDTCAGADETFSL